MPAAVVPETLAVVIEEDFIAKRYKNVGSTIEEMKKIVVRELQDQRISMRVQYHFSMKPNLRKDTSGIIMIASCENIWNLFERADLEFIPYIAITEDDCPRLPPDRSLSIPLIKLGQELPQLFLDLRTSRILQWKSVVLIYDGSLGRDMILQTSTALTKELTRTSTNPTSMSLIRISEKSDIKKSILNEMERIHPRVFGQNFVVITFRKRLDLFMEIAESRNLVNTESQWLYVLPDLDRSKKKQFKKIDNFLKDGSNIAIIYNDTISDIECQSGMLCSFRTFFAALSSALFDTKTSEIDLASQVSMEEWEAIRPTKPERRSFLLEKIKLHVTKNSNCDTCMNWLFRSADTWGHEYTNNNGSQSLQLEKVGHWSPLMGPEMLDELFLHVAHGFRGKQLQLATINNPPWQIVSTTNDGKKECRGLVFDIIDELAKKMNFTYEVDVLSFGQDMKNGRIETSNTSNSKNLKSFVTNWIPSILIENIQKKSVVIGAYGATISDKYAEDLDYTIPISTQLYTFLGPRPKELSRALLFMAPFSGDTWLCLLFAIVCIGPILYLIHKYSPLLEQKEGSSGLLSIQNCIWYIYGALLQQGGMYLPQTDSARILVGAWWLVVLVISTTYCGNLVAFLTFPEIDKPLRTIEDVINRRDEVSWNMISGSFLEEELKGASDSKYKILYDRRLRNQTEDQILSNVIQGKHVYIDWKIQLQYLMNKKFLETGKCEFALGSDEFFKEEIGLILSKNNPYLQRINKEIEKLHRVGLINKWLDGYLPKNEKCWKIGQILQANNHIVNMNDMQGSFFVLFLGN